MVALRGFREIRELFHDLMLQCEDREHDYYQILLGPTTALYFTDTPNLQAALAQTAHHANTDHLPWHQTVDDDFNDEFQEMRALADLCFERFEYDRMTAQAFFLDSIDYYLKRALREYIHVPWLSPIEDIAMFLRRGIMVDDANYELDIWGEVCGTFPWLEDLLKWVEDRKAGIPLEPLLGDEHCRCRTCLSKMEADAAEWEDDPMDDNGFIKGLKALTEDIAEDWFGGVEI